MTIFPLSHGFEFKGSLKKMPGLFQNAHKSSAF